MSRLRGRVKRLEANRPEDDRPSLSPLENFERILECAGAMADGKPPPYKLKGIHREVADQYAEEFRMADAREEAARAKLSYLLLSERDACLLIGTPERRDNLQEAYTRAIQEENTRAIRDNTGLIGHRDRTPEEEAARSEMLEDLTQRAKRLQREVAARGGREADPLRSWAEAEEEAFYVNSDVYLRKTHPEWYVGR